MSPRNPTAAQIRKTLNSFREERKARGEPAYRYAPTSEADIKECLEALDKAAGHMAQEEKPKRSQRSELCEPCGNCTACQRDALALVRVKELKRDKAALVRMVKALRWAVVTELQAAGADEAKVNPTLRGRWHLIERVDRKLKKMEVADATRKAKQKG